VLREQSSCLAIARTASPLRAITRISTACSWVNIDGTEKAVILTQVGHFHFGAVGQYYFGGNTHGRELSSGTRASLARAARLRFWSSRPSRR
jgi:hypothetical protein